jgi:hypothetical protein
LRKLIFFIFKKVHTCYGEQLGLTSDDEDYIDPSEDVISADSVSEEPGAETKASSSSSNHKPEGIEKFKIKKVKKSSINKEESQAAPPIISEQIPTDMTDR